MDSLYYHVIASYLLDDQSLIQIYLSTDHMYMATCKLNNYNKAKCNDITKLCKEGLITKEYIYRAGGNYHSLVRLMVLNNNVKKTSALRNHIQSTRSAVSSSHQHSFTDTMM